MTLKTDFTYFYSSNFFSRFLFKKRKKLLKNLRENWGREVRRKRDLETISIYNDFKTVVDKKEIVDDKTWTDLNLNDFFEKIDRCITPIGSQYLYHLLHVYEHDKSILDWQKRQYKLFIENSVQREKIQIILSKLNHKNTAYLPYLLYRDLPNRPKWYLLIYLFSLAGMALTFLVFSYSSLFWYTLSVLVINLILNHKYSKHINEYLIDLSFLSSMLKVVEKLSAENFGFEMKQVEKLKGLKDLARNVNKKIGWLTIDKTQANELSAAFIEYVNHFFLFDLISFVRAIRSIKQNQSNLQEMFKAIASLDAAISISSWIYGVGTYCFPEENNTNKIEFENVYHPLLEKAVDNSIVLDNTSCLITGSNMAGKTTFIKTISINMILAQTIGVCLANEAIIPKLIVKSSIRMEDNINEHKSYYFQEIEAVLEFIRKGERKGKYLFIIDEIFRGTNTVERVSAASSVLKVLGEDNITLVTTHDIELQDLLKDNFAMYHFSEQVEGDNHFFDYKLKPGPCSTRNAIRLLEIKGYPKKIIEQANVMALKLSSEMKDINKI